MDLAGSERVGKSGVVEDASGGARSFSLPGARCGVLVVFFFFFFLGCFCIVFFYVSFFVFVVFDTCHVCFCSGFCSMFAVFF